MDTSFCVAALEEALARYGKPGIFNTDQGSQFTSADFTGVLIEAGVRVSMDGRGRWMDNVFIERVWRSLKYEDVYSKATPTVARRTSANGSFSTTSARSSGARLSRADGRLARRRAAGSETAADRTLGRLIKDNQQTHFQLSRRQKRSRLRGATSVTVTPCFRRRSPLAR